MFEQAFKNIDDVLWKDVGCTSELDYTEQTSWLLFLKYLDALEHDKATGPNTIEYKIGEIFGEIKNRIQSGYNLREIIDHIDELRFGSQAEKHELSHLYEAKIKNMGNAGRNGGELHPATTHSSHHHGREPQNRREDLRSGVWFSGLLV